MLAAAAATLLAACTDDAPPTAPSLGAEDPTADAPAQQAPAGPSVFSDRAHALLGDGFELRSDAAEIAAGRYRFVSANGAYPAVERDGFVVVESADGPIVRRVLERREEGGALVLETGPAYWHEVVNGGTYSIRIPFDGNGGAALLPPGLQAAPIPLEAQGLPLPPVEARFDDTDVCAWIHDLLATLPGPEKTLCGKKVDMEVGAGVTVAVNGTLDSLRIIDGWVRISGTMDVDLTVDPGGISGGRVPRLAPCDRGFYLGCIQTPTGAALIEFLRRHVPSVPEASLPPVRLCIPGTPVRVQRGYWSGFTWHPPVWEKCRVSDAGQLPTVTLPAVHSAGSVVRPRVQGEMTVRAKGDGGFSLKIAVPGAAASAAYGANRLSAKASIGVFILLKAQMKNTGGTVLFTFDDTGLVEQDWDPQSGWTGDFALVEKSHNAQLLEIDNPDSVVVRVGVPIEAKAEVCIALAGCPTGSDSTKSEPKSIEDKALSLLKISLGAGAGVSMFQEATWTRDQVHPTEAAVDNWHVSLDGAYDLSVKAALNIPFTGWILPDVPREFNETWECCRVPVADYWGQGELVVTTATTGANPDPDGYTVIVERYDDTPALNDAGTDRIGPEWHPDPRDMHVGIEGTADFGEPVGLLPCVSIYSDALIFGNPVWGLAFAGARAKGLDIPTYAVTGPCPWLIARYKVTLTDVSPDCSVVDGPVRDDVWLQQADVSIGRSSTRTVHFDVDCSTPAEPGPTGSLRVLLPNYPFTERPYLLIDGVHAGVFPDNDTLVVEAVKEGTRQIDLARVEPRCPYPPMQSVDVVAGATVELNANWICALVAPEPGDVTFASSLEGDGADPNGYRIVVNGVSAAALPVEGESTIAGIAPQTPTVFHVADVSGACQPLGPNPRVVTLSAVAAPISVPFAVRCIDEKPDTLVGSIDASGWPIPTVTLRAADGTTLQVNGPRTSELARLSGTSVRAWGAVSATGIDVHGYDLRSALGDDRWLGIVLDRADGTWLMGEEAIELVNAPASLRAASGSLVWIVGIEVGGGVQPTLFGVVRSGS